MFEVQKSSTMPAYFTTRLQHKEKHLLDVRCALMNGLRFAMLIMISEFLGCITFIYFFHYIFTLAPLFCQKNTKCLNATFSSKLQGQSANRYFEPARLIIRGLKFMPHSIFPFRHSFSYLFGCSRQNSYIPMTRISLHQIPYANLRLKDEYIYPQWEHKQKALHHII